MAIARAALGMSLRVSNGATTPAYFEIALVGNITGPGMKKETIDVTNHNNTSRYRNFIGSLKDGGEVKFDLFFDPTDATQNGSAGTTGGTPTPPGLLALFEANYTLDFQLAFPIVLPATARATAWNFNGLVTGFDNKYDVTGAIMASCTIKVNGSSSLVAITS